MSKTGMRVSVDGVDRLRSKLEQLPDHIRQGAHAAVAAQTEQIADDMRRGAPRDTGELADSVITEVDGLSGTVTATARYAAYVEFGTSSAPEQPFALPAAETARSQFPGRVREQVGEQVRGLTE